MPYEDQDDQDSSDELLRRLGFLPEINSSTLPPWVPKDNSALSSESSAPGEETPAPPPEPKPAPDPGSMPIPFAGGLSSDEIKTLSKPVTASASAPNGAAAPGPSISKPIAHSQWSPGEDRVSQKHPFLGGVLKGLDVAGSLIAPGYMGLIPGTRINAGLRNQAEAERQRQTADIAHEEAQTEETKARTDQMENPAPKPGILHETDQGLVLVHPDTGQATPITLNGQPLRGKDAGSKAAIHETDQGLMLIDPAKGTATPVVYQGQPLKGKAVAPKSTKEQLQAQLIEAQNAGDLTKARKIQQQLKDIDPLGENRIAVTVAGQNAANERGQQRATDHQIDKHDAKYVEPARGVEKSYSMMNQAFREYTEAKAQGKELPTGAQSMLALSTHLATTFGNVKGSRVTKDMIQEHLGARSISDSMLVAMQRFTNGDVLSPEQWKAFHDLIGQSRYYSWDGAVKEADRKHIPIDFLPDDLQAVRVPGHKAGVILKSKLAEFQRANPKAEVLGE